MSKRCVEEGKIELWTMFRMKTKAQILDNEREDEEGTVFWTA